METNGGELGFNDYSRSAVQAIRDGFYSLAATLATIAYNATSDPSEKARMARDVGNGSQIAARCANWELAQPCWQPCNCHA